MSSATPPTTVVPSFAAPPPVEDLPVGDESMPPELTEPVLDDECDDEAPGPRLVWSPDVDWYLDTTETVWLSAVDVREQYPGAGRFAEAAAADEFGLRGARRRTWVTLPERGGNGRRYRAFAYPLWRARLWREGTAVEGDPTDLDRAEAQWLTADRISAVLGVDRTTFQHAVRHDAAGLRSARRPISVTGARAKSRQMYVYPQWRVREWAGDSELTPATLPTPQAIRQLRTDLDSAASLLARDVGFSATEVRTAARIGDLPARIDPNSGKLLFLNPRDAQAWSDRAAWRHAG